MKVLDDYFEVDTRFWRYDGDLNFSIMFLHVQIGAGHALPTMAAIVCGARKLHIHDYVRCLVVL